MIRIFVEPSRYPFEIYLRSSLCTNLVDGFSRVQNLFPSSWTGRPPRHCSEVFGARRHRHCDRVVVASNGHPFDFAMFVQKILRQLQRMQAALCFCKPACGPQSAGKQLRYPDVFVDKNS